MRKSTIALCMLVVALVSTGCEKHEVDITELTTNPFDADYDGAPIFTYVSASTTTVLVNGMPTDRLTVQVRIHTGLFGRPTTYRVEAGDPVNTVVSSNEVEDGLFTMNIANTTPGQQYCVPLRLVNGGVYGGGNSVCATAE